jgi:hypothetical protein
MQHISQENFFTYCTDKLFLYLLSPCISPTPRPISVFIIITMISLIQQNSKSKIPIYLQKKYISSLLHFCSFSLNLFNFPFLFYPAFFLLCFLNCSPFISALSEQSSRVLFLINPLTISALVLLSLYPHHLSLCSLLVWRYGLQVPPKHANLSTVS